jgi:ADP-dependent NAD(P)H-hydrate dehydratase / NAD(P)H-hydrate epimerase
MRYAYQVAAVRVAERALMDLVPEGALMQRAAAGLASACASLLATHPGHVYGARVVVLAGSGDNGGDALYAGALLARRGAAVTAIAAAPKIHEGGRTELRAAGGRVINGGAGLRGDEPQSPPGTPRLQDAADLIARADLIMDGLLGIGGRGGLREPFAGLARLTEQARQGAARQGAARQGAARQGGARQGGARQGGARQGGARQGGPAYAGGSRRATVVAVDLPSGIDADTGAVQGPAVRADVTVTFGTIKPGLLIDPGAGYAGAVELVDIGLRPYLTGEPAALAPQRDDISERLPRPGPESDKYRRGVVGLLAGSDRFAGAAVLATGGAVRGGAGMVRVATAAVPAAAVRQAWPEAVLTVHPDQGDWDLDSVGRVQAWVAGPGMGTDPDATARLAAVLATGLPVLVDADGLTIVSQTAGLLPRSKGSKGAPTLITPHAGELARLLGTDPADVEARRLEHARRAADELGVTVLLKGSTTVIARPGHPTVLVNPTGTPWLATAGTGDVLSGLAGALLAQGLEPAWAAATAAYLHGMAARLAAAGAQHPGEQLPAGVPVPEAPIGASDVVRSLSDAFRSLAAP